MITMKLQTLGLAAALLSSGSELLHVDKTNPKRAVFLFRQTEFEDRLASSYINNQLQVPARTYFDAIKQLKSRLYES